MARLSTASSTFIISPFTIEFSNKTVLMFITGQVVEVMTPAPNLSGVGSAQDPREVGWGGDGGGSSELDAIQELLLKLRERRVKKTSRGC
jgi:hypothetical protein